MVQNAENTQCLVNCVSSYCSCLPLHAVAAGWLWHGTCRAAQPSVALPDAAGVVLAARDDGIPLVVEGTAEHLVAVSLQALQAVTRLRLPQQRRLVAAGGENLSALRVEGDLGDLALVPDENGAAVSVVRVVQAGSAIRRRRDNLQTHRATVGGGEAAAAATRLTRVPL